MRYGLFSDIHGNLEALQAVLEALRKEDIDSYICLGDIVSYGANPRECIELIKNLNSITIAGNHDYAVVNLTDLSYFNSNAKEAILWTQNQLKEEDKEFLSALKLVHHFSDFTIVHANLKEPEKWDYIFSLYEARESFQLLAAPLLFVGHSHIPIVFEDNAHYSFNFQKVVSLEKGRKYIINIGSVGQPRDGDSRASFALYDTESRLVEIKRVEYSIPETMKKIIEVGLPKILALRLIRGK